MTNLTRHEPRRYRGLVERDSIDLEASAKIFQGAAIEEGANGGAQNLTGVGTTFLGIVEEGNDNTGGALGDKRCTYASKGTFRLWVDNNAVAYVRTAQGAAVYASDGNTFTTVSTSNQQIGKIAEVPPETVGLTVGWIWVAVEGVHRRSI